jgi:hypothetical protein
MPSTIEKLGQIERDVLHERFAYFERGVLQDNIILCDAKSGVLLAFTGAMIVFCLDTFVSLQRAAPAADPWRQFAHALFLLAALGFLVSCYFSLATVVPRLRRGKADHVFWEAPVFRLSEDAYVAEMEKLDTKIERNDMLRHLYLLAGVCRTKFNHFQVAIRFGQIGFLTLVLAEFGRIIS